MKEKPTFNEKKDYILWLFYLSFCKKKPKSDSKELKTISFRKKRK